LLPEQPAITTSRRPVRLTLVLDVSGSMSANYAGWCDRTTLAQPPPPEGYWQCANGFEGGPVAQVTDTGPYYYWSKVEERRIYAAKYALERIVRQMNLPGNAGHRPEFPSDEVSLVWFNHESGPANTTPYSSDVTALVASIRAAGSYDGDPYRTFGGSNIAAGLYRASLGLNAAPATVEFDGTTYRYVDKVVLITDSVANTFLDPSSPSLRGPNSDSSTYRLDHPCRSVEAVRDNAPCQTTEVGGLTTGVGGVPVGLERPITQAVLVSRAELQLRAEVFVGTVSPVSSLGLKDGVATNPSYFYALPGLSVSPGGTTSMDEAIDRMLEALGGRVLEGACTAAVGPEWVREIPPQHLPQTFVVTPPTVGMVRLEGAEGGAVYEEPIVVSGPNNTMSYTISHVPPGTYTLSAYVFYRGGDGVTRLYNRVEVDGALYEQILLDWKGVPVFPPLSLRLGGDVCASP
jgi:hypothetical protein